MAAMRPEQNGDNSRRFVNARANSCKVELESRLAMPTVASREQGKRGDCAVTATFGDYSLGCVGTGTIRPQLRVNTLLRARGA
jgi:hypothetical protein